MPERAGREVDSSQDVLRMRPEGGLVAAKGPKFLIREPSGLVESRIQGEGCVTFREDEAVAIPVVGQRQLKRASKQRGDDVGDGKARADVADVCLFGFVDDCS